MAVKVGREQTTTGLSQPGRPFTDLHLRFDETGRLVSFTAQANVLFNDGDQGQVAVDVMPLLLLLTSTQQRALQDILTALGAEVKRAVE